MLRVLILASVPVLVGALLALEIVEGQTLRFVLMAPVLVVVVAMFLRTYEAGQRQWPLVCFAGGLGVLFLGQALDLGAGGRWVSLCSCCWRRTGDGRLLGRGGDASSEPG